MQDSRYTTDSALVTQAMTSAARSVGLIQNPLLGSGGLRDPLSYASIGQTRDLSDRELADLYSGNHLIQKIVGLYPTAAAKHWLKFSIGGSKKYGSYGVADADLQGYLNSRCDREGDELLSMGSLSSLFRIASLNARLFGVAYLLLGIDDGQEWSDPINAQTIKSLRWVEPIYHYEVVPVQGAWHYSNPQFYRLSWNQARENDEIPRDRIHRSRIIPFYGVSMPEYVLRARGGRPLSVVQGVFRALANATESIDSAIYLLNSASLFTYGLKGLSQIQDATQRKVIESRFESIMLTLANRRGLPHDAESESIGFASRNLGGVTELAAFARNEIATNCDVPRFKLFEESDQKGLSGGDKSKAERYLWSQLEVEWRDLNWRDAFLYLGKIAVLAKDSPTNGRSLKDLSVDIPSSLQQTPEEELAMRKQHLETMAIALSNGIVKPHEVRSSTYESAWSYDIHLDDRASKAIEEEALMTPQHQPEQ